MAPYRSHFATLIKARSYRQEQVHRELIECESLLLLEEEALNKLTQNSERCLEQISHYQTGAGHTNEIQDAYGYIHLQREKIRQQQDKMVAFIDAVEEKRDELREVVQEKQIVERLEAKQKDVYLAELRKKETNFLDDIAGRLKGGIR